MTEIAAVNLNAIQRSFARPNLTKEQVFRLWRCAVMDDDKLYPLLRLSQRYTTLL